MVNLFYYSRLLTHFRFCLVFSNFYPSRGPTGLPDPDRMDDSSGDQPSTSDGRPGPSDDNSKPKTQAQIKSESAAQKIVSESDGCSYDFR